MDRDDKQSTIITLLDLPTELLLLLLLLLFIIINALQCNIQLQLYMCRWV